ncbi:hypothetical protein JCM31826_06480 [Thermaurantimonas aggregans]|uniref:Secretion system C-terminal sorting domain-containing protein n=2 Tax=Thermaurantimonas aggregans TaxID=2173829 RepID=A0A401XJH9_9FLAO|nr:hypothetical protein JCM31826_06480 [Thermaurantimonas aggregans]
MNYYRISDMIYENSDSYLYVFNEKFTVRYQEINPLLVIYDKKGIYKESYWIDESGVNKYSNLNYALPIDIEKRDFLMAFTIYKKYIFRRKFDSIGGLLWEYNYPYSVGTLFISDKIYDDKVKIIYLNNQKQLLLTTVRVSDGKMDTIGDLFDSYLSVHKSMFKQIYNFFENDTYLIIQFTRYDGAEYVLCINKTNQTSQIFPSNDYGNLVLSSDDATLLFMKQDDVNPHALTIINLSMNSVKTVDYKKIDSTTKYVVITRYDREDKLFEIKFSNRGRYTHYFDHLVYMDTTGNVIKKYSYDITVDPYQYSVNSLAMKKLKLEPGFIGVMYVGGTNQIFKTDSCGQIFADVPGFKYTFTQPTCGKFVSESDTSNTDNGWQFSVFPNPNNGNFTLITPDIGLIDILSPTGQVIKSYEILEKMNEFHVSNLSVGLYFLRYTTPKGKVHVKKFVIY